EGEVSVDADVLVRVMAQCIDEVLIQAGPLADEIAAVATDTFWHSLVGVDEDGRAVTSLMTWEDTRPREAAVRLCERMDESVVHARTGARLHASYWPAKLAWMQTSQP